MRLPKTLQVWHGTSHDEKLVDVPTADGKKVEVTVWAVWKITDPAQFVRTLRTVPNAESRVKEFVRSTARDTITTNNLAEIVRSTNRKMTYTLGLPPEMVATGGRAGQEGRRCRAGPGHARLYRSPRGQGIGLAGTAQDHSGDQGKRPACSGPGRTGPGRRAAASSWSTSACLGSSSCPQVREAAFDRAISLMEAIAVKTISEGEQRKKEIINKTQAEVQKIEGEGKQEANILKGRVDAEIIDSYAKAIRETGEFYNFTRTLEIYKEALKGDTRLILTTDSDLLRMIKTLEPAKTRASRPGSVATQPAGVPASAASGPRE